MTEEFCWSYGGFAGVGLSPIIMARCASLVECMEDDSLGPSGLRAVDHDWWCEPCQPAAAGGGWPAAQALESITRLFRVGIPAMWHRHIGRHAACRSRWHMADLVSTVRRSSRVGPR